MNYPKVLNNSVLNQIKELVFTKNREYCGKMVSPNTKIDVKKRNLRMEITDEGPVIDDTVRAQCEQQNTPLIWHTHPQVKGVLPWPSTEDVFAVLSDNEVDVEGNVNFKTNRLGSLIFTEWGIWEIVARQKVYVSALQQLYGGFNKMSDMFYFDVVNLKDNKVKDVSTVIANIDGYRKGWLNTFDDGKNRFEMYFTPWSDIGDTFKLKSTVLNSVPYNILL